MNSILKIDPEFEKVVPKLSQDEFDLLEEEILKAGRIINPIVTWNGIIVDGHNRYKIAQKHREIPFETVEMKFDCRDSAIIWICNAQLGRRNLTAESKRYLVGKRYEAEKHYEKFLGNQYTIKRDADYHRFNHGTRSKIAQEYGVSESYVKRAYDYSRGVDAGEKVSPKFKREALSGNLKATIEEVAKLNKLPAEKRKLKIQQLRMPVEERIVDTQEEDEEKETMNFKKFNNYMTVIENAMDAEKNDHSKSTEKVFAKTKVWALNKLESIFDDVNHNVQRWLEHKPCIFSSRQTGRDIEIKIGNDREVLYRFLVFCYKDREGSEISQDFFDNLILDITRSTSPNWEES